LFGLTFLENARYRVNAQQLEIYVNYALILDEHEILSGFSASELKIKKLVKII